jgi:single-strand DNA-binding protein
MNVVALVGTVVEEPVSTPTTGSVVTRFRIKTLEHFTKDGERTEHAEFHSVVVWGKRGELFEKGLGNGSVVSVTGPIRTSSWTAEGETKKRYRTEVNGDKVHVLNHVKKGAPTR